MRMNIMPMCAEQVKIWLAVMPNERQPQVRSKLAIPQMPTRPSLTLVDEHTKKAEP